LGNWQRRGFQQVYAFFPDGRCKAWVGTDDSHAALLDGVYLLGKSMLTLSIDNSALVRIRAFVTNDMLALTSLEAGEKELLDRF
jgi:hypothetical protein